MVRLTNPFQHATPVLVLDLLVSFEKVRLYFWPERITLCRSGSIGRVDGSQVVITMRGDT